jgi:hypothetical protein
VGLMSDSREPTVTSQGPPETAYSSTGTAQPGSG